jgi:hypothetical protein
VDRRLGHECRLTTPHKLQAEARSRKRARRRQVVCPSHKPTAEACQLHAVVRQLATLKPVQDLPGQESIEAVGTDNRDGSRKLSLHDGREIKTVVGEW